MKHDVRMRGFVERVDVEVVDAYLGARARPLAGESVPVDKQAGDTVQFADLSPSGSF